MKYINELDVTKRIYTSLSLVIPEAEAGEITETIKDEVIERLDGTEYESLLTGDMLKGMNASADELFKTALGETLNSYIN